MGNIGIIGGGHGLRGLTLMAMLAMSLENPPVLVCNPKTEPKEKLPEYIKKIGNGKKKFDFETEYGLVEIWADNPKSANKKLITINGINSGIYHKRRIAGLNNR